jgi:hypothetical protein
MDLRSCASEVQERRSAIARWALPSLGCAETDEFVQLMHRSDPGSFAYRYPVDTKHRPASRHRYVDLKELEAAGAKFQASTIKIVDALTEAEPVPITDAEVESTAGETEALLRAIRSSNTFWTQTYSEIVANRDRLAALTGRRVEGEQVPTQKAAADEYMELFSALEPQLLLLLRRLEPRRESAPVASLIEPDPVTPLPQMTIGTPQAVKAQLDTLINAYVEGLAPRFLELKRTLTLLCNRTENWQTPADRQLHADLGRFASRLMSGVDPLTQSTTPSSPPQPSTS